MPHPEKEMAWAVPILQKVSPRTARVKIFVPFCFVSYFPISLDSASCWIASDARCIARGRVMNDQQRVEEGCDLRSLCGI